MSTRKGAFSGRRSRSHQSVLVLGLIVATFACSPADGSDGGDGGQDTAGVAAAPAEPAGDRVVAPGRPPGGHAWVIFEADTVLAEVAATAAQREQGLMYREDVPDGTGMLFVFQDNRERAFWMANTYVPLDIAYMDPSFRVVSIVPMEPLVTETYPSNAPAMYALEVRQGWFDQQGIGVGAQAQIVFGAGGPR